MVLLVCDIPVSSKSYAPSHDHINGIFWPVILDGNVSTLELSLFTARLGRMDINIPVDCAGIAFTTSNTYTKKIVDAIKGQEEFCVFDRTNQMCDAKKELSNSQQGELKSPF